MKTSTDRLDHLTDYDIVIPVLNLVRFSLYLIIFSSDMLSTGDSKGTVKIWKVSEGLATQARGEAKLLERIAASSYE